MAHFSREFRAHAPVANFWRLKFSEMQSSTFWMQMPGYLRKKNSQTKWGARALWAHPKSALDPRGLNPPYPRTTFLHKKLPLSLP